MEGRDRTGPSHSWKWGSGAGSELVMMAAVHLMSVQARKKKKKKGKTDTRRKTPPATPVQIHVAKQRTVCRFVILHNMKWQCIYSYVSLFHTAKNQASDHNLILIL